MNLEKAVEMELPSNKLTVLKRDLNDINCASSVALPNNKLRALILDSKPSEKQRMRLSA